MKKTASFLITLVLTLLSQTAIAQNMTLKDAIDNLNGNWYLQANNSTLTFLNSWQPNKRSGAVSGFATKQYDYWSIYTNTRNFVAGTIQATNSNPSFNDSYRYRNLTPNTCEFYIDGEWIAAVKGDGQSRPVVTITNNEQLPTNDNSYQSTNHQIEQTTGTSVFQLITNGNQLPVNNNIQQHYQNDATQNN